MTEEMAGTRPAAVVIRASEIPGATAARLAEPWEPIFVKAFMIPHTVPNSPTNGVTAPVVARARQEVLRALPLRDGHPIQDAADSLDAARNLGLRDRPGDLKAAVVAAHGLRGDVTESGLEEGDQGTSGETIAPIPEIREIARLIQGREEGEAAAAGATIDSEPVDNDPRGPGRQKHEK